MSHGSSARPASIAREHRKDAHWLNFSKQNIPLDLTATKQTYYGAWGQKVTLPCGVPNECAPAKVLGLTQSSVDTKATLGCGVTVSVIPPPMEILDFC